MAPVLIILVFGIIEFAWTLGQHLDVRHGAREAGRLAAVNYDPDDQTGSAQAQTIIDAVCERMDHPDGVTITMVLGDTSGELPNARGNWARVVVEREPQQITGLFAPILDPITLRSEVEVRLEQNATWTSSPWTAQSRSCA